MPHHGRIILPFICTFISASSIFDDQRLENDALESYNAPSLPWVGEIGQRAPRLPRPSLGCRSLRGHRENEQEASVPRGGSLLCNAKSRYLIKVSTWKGLLRKPIAPACIARTRIRSSGNAVMKIIGVRRPRAWTRLCSSMPLMPGIFTSAIRQDVSSTCSHRKYSSAEAKVWAVNPSDRTRPPAAVRTDLSSSTIEITGEVCKRSILGACVQHRARIKMGIDARQSSHT